LLLKALEGRKVRPLWLVLSLFCFVLAMMTRYEAWIVIPILSFYYYWNRRDVSTSSLVALALVAFPIAWVMGNYIHSGDFLPAFSAHVKTGAEAVGAHSVGLLAALKIIAGSAVSYLGWILFLAVLLGIVLQIIHVVKGNVTTDRMLYIGIMVFFWLFMTTFAMARGTSLCCRYLLFGFVMFLPVAGLPFVKKMKSSAKWEGIITFTAVASVFLTFVIGPRPTIYVRPYQPREIKAIAAWLQSSPYRSDTILMTKMGWQSSYLPLYFPEASRVFITATFQTYYPQIDPRAFIVSPWATDDELDNFLKKQQPSLLITSDKDQQYQSRISALLPRKIDEHRMVFAEGSMRVYDLRSSTRNHLAHAHP
jgi:hypothetical protein